MEATMADASFTKFACNLLCITCSDIPKLHFVVKLLLTLPCAHCGQAAGFPVACCSKLTYQYYRHVRPFEYATATAVRPS